MSNELFLAVVIMDWYTSHGYFFLHLAGLRAGIWGVLLVSVLIFSIISDIFLHELILPLAVIPAPYRLDSGYFFPNKYLGLKFWE